MRCRLPLGCALRSVFHSPFAAISVVLYRKRDFVCSVVLQNQSLASENDSILSNSPSRKSRTSIHDLSFTSATSTNAAASPLARAKHVSPPRSQKQKHTHGGGRSLSPLRPKTLLRPKQLTEGSPPPKPRATNSMGNVSQTKRGTKKRDTLLKSALGVKADDPLLFRSKDGLKKPILGEFGGKTLPRIVCSSVICSPTLRETVCLPHLNLQTSKRKAFMNFSNSLRTSAY